MNKQPQGPKRNTGIYVKFAILMVASALAGAAIGALLFGREDGLRQLLQQVSDGLILAGPWLLAAGLAPCAVAHWLYLAGKKAAAMTLAGDMLKGVAAVVFCRWAGMLITGGVEVNGVYAGYIAAIGAMCGHLWPVWFGFRGGKGVAVAAGAILASEPVVLLALAVVFFTLAFATRIVSLASVTVAVLYPIFTGLYSWYAGRDILFTTLCALVMGLLVIWMHRANIQRLANGTEYRFGEKKK